MRRCIKRFIWPLGFLILGLILVLTAEFLPEGPRRALDALALLAVGPLVGILLIWAAVRAVMALYRVCILGEDWPETPLLIEGWRMELENVRGQWQAFSGGQKAAYLLLRGGGVAVFLAGLVVICLGRHLIGGLLLILGAVMRLASAPPVFHSIAFPSRTVACPEGTYITKLYKALRRVNTQLGTPYLGSVRYVEGPCLLLGPDLDGKFLYGHLSRSGRQFRFTAAPSDTLIESVRTMPLRTAEDYPLGAPVVDHTVLLEGLAQMLRRYFDAGELRLELPKPEGN